MSTQRWQQIEEVFHGALELPADAREDYLKNVCAGDIQLQLEATSLIEAHQQAGDFIDEPALVRDAHVLVSVLPDPNVGRILGHYEIIERIGSGGMGDVYRARDSRLERDVALKILPAPLVSEPNHMRRFEAEARAVSKLNHPNVLTVHEVGSIDGVNYIATELVDGETLRQLITSGNLSLADVLGICAQVASALAAAHESGIIHRDIKPENVMRRRDGLVKVLDFGIAKPTGPFLTNHLGNTSAQTEVGVVLGTVAYMSPEQARGFAVDQRTDIWSLGVVLYELLSGAQPFTGQTRMDTLAAILEREPVPLFGAQSEGAKELQLILDRSLCKSVEQRYRTAGEMSSDLKEAKENIDGTILLPRKEIHFAVSDDAKTIRKGLPRASRFFHWLAPAAVLLAVSILIFLSFANRDDRLHKNAATSISPGIETRPYASMTDEEKLAFVQRQEQRISAMMGDRPAKLSEEALLSIKRKLDSYDARRLKAATEPGVETLQETYGRAVPFVPLIARSFAAEKVPLTIGIYLPMIESEYRQCSESQLGAKGMFQFLPQTAQQYGVAPDEMCDVNKMTPAAARYIADRMAELGEDSQSMTLVLLSYNRGAEWVREKLRELRGTENFKRDFWTLFAHRNEFDETFRNENAHYVPRFFAAAIVGENPQAFGLTTPPLSSLDMGK